MSFFSQHLLSAIVLLPLAGALIALTFPRQEPWGVRGFALAVTLADFALVFVLLVALLLWHGVVPGVAALALPLLVVQTLAAALGIALWLSAVNTLYRDVRVALPFLIQLGMLVTPIV